MANPLNLYATKTFSEHPLGLWALDDQADYISLIPNEYQDLSTWTSTGVASIVDASTTNTTLTPSFKAPPAIPFPDKIVNGIRTTAEDSETITLSSPFVIASSDDIDVDQETFAISAYVYSYGRIIDFRIGFVYTDTSDSENPVERTVMKAASFSTAFAWAFVSETFNLPEYFEDLEIFFEIYDISYEGSYDVVINGITFGQWSEEFNVDSFGVNLINVPSTIAIPETQGLPARAYGLDESVGYYIADGNHLAARNYGLPLVFGSSNSTHIIPKENSPSLIVPGFGFMNQSGQFNSLTAEFWIKIQSFATEPRKIFGPISSDDGLYVDGPFLRVRIGDRILSHFVREWDRPMLVNIRLSENACDLIINGESVGRLLLDSSLYLFPSSVKDNLSQDWLGFYAHQDVPLIQLDCVGIYPYEVAELVAKRRFVYGQGVEVPSNIKGLDSSSSVFIDFPFAKYAKNFYFPISSDWSGGSIENLTVESGGLRAPEYSRPSFRFNNKTENEWYTDLASIQEDNNSKINLRPNSSWKDTSGHIAFANMNFLKEQTRGFYGVFESLNLSINKRVLFEIVNTITGNRIQVYSKANENRSTEDEEIETEQAGRTVTISGRRHGLRTGMEVLISGTDRVPQGFYEVFVISDTSFSYSVSENQSATVENEVDEEITYSYDSTIYYSFITKQFDGSFNETIFYRANGHKANKRFMVGLHLPRFIKERGEELANFFGSRQNLAIYVGGSEFLTETFDGNIYSIGFCSERNLKKIEHLFNDAGIPVDYENAFDNFSVNIYDAGDEYFGNDEDYWSLILDGGDPYDFQSITATDHIATYTLIPKIQMGMFLLDIAIDGYWEDYVPLSYFAKESINAFNKKESTVSFLQINLDYPNIKKFDNLGNYDTSDNLIKSYVAFQYLKDGANLTESDFHKKESLSRIGVVRPGQDWMTTKYEVVDGTIVYLPPGVSLKNLSISFYLEFNINGVFSNPIKIRSLEASSQAFGASPNKIGTKFGTDLVPFRRAGQYFDYRSVSPFAIYKGSTPYLYNTSNSGIEIRGDYNNLNKSGISIPINKNASPFFKIGSMQMSLKYGEDLFPEVPIKIFEIESELSYIKFFLIADSKNRKRGQIYAVDANNNRLQRNLVFYANGKTVKRPVLYSNTWAAIGLSFPSFLNLNASSSALRITSPIMFDNFSFYQTNKADDDERFGYRQWFGVSNALGGLLDWGYWANLEISAGEIVEADGESFVWEDVLFLSSTLRQELTAADIYKIYTGTSRTISESDQLFLIKDYQYKTYNGIRWNQNTSNPV